MARKPTTLWKPGERDTRTYTMCADALCLNPVGKPGDRCPAHQRKERDDRAPHIFLF